MLALDRPLGVVAGLALFGDHADEDRVYYIPTRPRLARVGSGNELSFVKFRPSDATEEGVGLLSFTTELVATDEQLELVADHLVDQGVSQPVLAQVPWLSGKAFFAAALEEGDGFVEKLLGEITPDLVAGNRATFSVLLGEEGARLVEALLDVEGPNPLGVRYELEYAGLQPALDVRLRADYSRVYEELSWGFEIGVAYEGVGVRAGVESATQKLVESGAIQVEVLHFTDDADLQQRVDQAIQWFQDKILEDFFESSIQPPARENLLQRAIDAATALGAASLDEALADDTIAGRLAEELGISTDLLGALGQGGGGQGGASASESTFALKLQFTYRDIKQEELKTITLDWSEARAERRTAAPQGLLSNFGVAPQIVEAEDSGDFWDRLEVNVRPLGEFTSLGVERLVVQIAYPDEDAPQTTMSPPATFESGQSDPKRFAAWTNGGPLRYRTNTEVHFRDDGPWPGPPVFVSPWVTRDSLELAVHPLSEVPRLEIEVSPGTVQFAETPQVQVDLRIDGDPAATHMLTESEPTATFRRRIETVEPGAEEAEDARPTPLVEARMTWFLSDGGRVEGDWNPVEGTTLLVHNPWRSHRTTRVFPLLPDDFIEALVTLSLSEGGRSRDAELRFQPGERRTKAVTLPSLEEEPPPVQVNVLVIRGDGSVFSGQPFETSDPVVMVRDRDGDHRQVGVRLLAGQQLADHGLMAVQVQLLGDGDETLDAVVFTESQREPGILLAPVGEDGAATVRYRVVRFALNGSAASGEVKESNESELLVPAVAPG